MTVSARWHTATSRTAAVLVAYLVVVGGTTWGEVNLWPRLLNAAIACVLIGLYIVRIREADSLDRLIVLAVACFAITGIISQYPRQSLDAILAALAYAAGLFVARGLLVRDDVRRAVIGALMLLSLVLTLFIASRWMVVIDWWQLTGWSVTPPLNMELDATPWGHRHDAALLVAMLYPAWWIGTHRSVLRTGLGIITGILGIFIVVVDGSRALWLALLVATAALGVPRFARVMRTNSAARAGVALALVAIVGLALLGGPARALLERVLTFDTLVARAEMWEPLTSVWLANPIGGLGPASFPWALQHTSYFDANAWAPRHPDSVVVQLMVEGGVLGFAALVLVVLAVAPAIVRFRHLGPRWALIAFVVAGIGSNPTEFAFLIVPAIAWTAYGVPRVVEARPPRRGRLPTLATASLAAFAIIGAAHASGLAGVMSYEAARGAAGRGDLEAAVDHIRVARRFDPSLALYPRLEGTLDLIRGDPDAAIRHLSRASSLNQSDDVAWRVLALAHLADGDETEAVRALNMALATQRSDPTNLLLEARFGDELRSQEAVAELVQTWPLLLLAPGWEELTALSDQDVIALAIDRWSHEPDSPEREVDQALLLVAFGSRGDLVDEAVAASPLSPGLAEATIAVARCDPDAGLMLDRLSNAERRTSVYWALRLRSAAAGSQGEDRARQLYQIMTGRTLEERSWRSTLSPLDENDLAGFSLDEWGYRRPPFPSLDYAFTLPSPNAGRTRWLLSKATSRENPEGSPCSE